MHVWRNVEKSDDGFELLYDISDDIDADKKWLTELHTSEIDVKKYYRHYLRAQNTTEKIVSMLKDIGSVHIFIGFESSNDNLSKKMNKRAKTEDDFKGN